MNKAKKKAGAQYESPGPMSEAGVRAHGGKRQKPLSWAVPDPPEIVMIEPSAISHNAPGPV